MATKPISDDSFEADVINADEPVLVDFWAEWCGPCKMISPIIDELASDFEGKAKVGKVDIDSQADLAAKFGVSSIPTLLVLKDGEEAQRFVGVTTKDVLAKALEAAAS